MTNSLRNSSPADRQARDRQNAVRYTARVCDLLVPGSMDADEYMYEETWSKETWAKHDAQEAVVLNRDAPRIPEDMFDENRANICQDCRGLKVTDRTPSRMFKDRDICSCNCESALSRCHCNQPRDHKGPHVCDCTGSWDYHGTYVEIFAWPQIRC